MAGGPDAVLSAHAAALDAAIFCGDGALRYQNEIHRQLPHARIEPAVPALAGAIGLVAAAQPERGVGPHAVIPIYVRRPDVEVARERRRGTP
jgi:hypothetical protein